MSYTQLKAKLKALAGPNPINPPDTEQEFSRQLPQLLLEGQGFRRLKQDKATFCLVSAYGLCGHPRLSVSAIANREGVHPDAVVRLINFVLEAIARALVRRAWEAEFLDVDEDGRPRPARAEIIRRFCGLPPSGDIEVKDNVIPLFRARGPSKSDSLEAPGLPGLDAAE